MQKERLTKSSRIHTKTQSTLGARNFRLALMADGAVLSFVVIECHHEHVITADAHPMNLGLRLAISSSFGGSVRSLRFAHKSILSRTRPGKHHANSLAHAIVMTVWHLSPLRKHLVMRVRQWRFRPAS